jgi:cytochrome c biogenesis protein CcdA
LAAQRRELAQVSVTMLAFGVGASLPLIGLGIASRRMMARWRGSLVAIGQRGKAVLGALACVIGLFILAGLDRPLETFFVSVSPDWLTRLTIQF